MLSKNNPFTLLSLAVKNGEKYSLEYEIDVFTSTQFMSAEFQSGYHELPEDDTVEIRDIFDRLNIHAAFILNRAFIPDFVIARYYQNNYGVELFEGCAAAMMLIESETVEGSFPLEFDDYLPLILSYSISQIALSPIQEAVTFSVQQRAQTCTKVFKYKTPAVYINAEHARKSDMISFPFFDAVKQDLRELQAIMREWVMTGVAAQKRQLELFNSGDYQSRIEGSAAADDDDSGDGVSDFADGMLDDEIAKKSGEILKDFTEGMKNAGFDIEVKSGE